MSNKSINIPLDENEDHENDRSINFKPHCGKRPIRKTSTQAVKCYATGRKLGQRE